MDDKILEKLSNNFKDGREKMEAIEHIIYTLNKYIRSPEELNESFTNYITQAINNILSNSNIYGQKGDELASDLIFRCTKLFINFSEKKLRKKNYSKNLFELIRYIFDKYYEHSFFVTKKEEKGLVKGTHKDLTYEDFNKFFGTDFEITKNTEKFEEGEKVDIYTIRNKINSGYDKGEWVKGKIEGVDLNNREYNIRYHPQIGSSYTSKISYPIDSPKIAKNGKKTKYLEFKLYLREKDQIDLCVEKDKKQYWYLATISEVVKKGTDIEFAEFTVELSDNIADDKNNIDNESDMFYEGNERGDITIPYDSYKVQISHVFSDIQQKYFNMLNDKKNELANNYEDLLNFINYIFENDQNIEDFYNYEIRGIEENKINYIIGKFPKNYSFYFAKLLKAMADNGHFESIKKILLEDNPTIEEIKTIFCILINSVPFIHRDYYKNNYSIFEKAVFNVIGNSEEKNNMTKKDFDNFIFFLIKIKFLINYNDIVNFNIKEEIDKLYLKLGLEMMESKIYNIRKIGLEMILDCADYSLDEDSFILRILEENNFLDKLFNSEKYNTQFISKSFNIFKLMLKNGHLNEKQLELIWNFSDNHHTDKDLEKIIIELFEKLLDNLKIEKEKKYCSNLLNIILSKNQIEKIDSLYILNNKLAQKGNIIEEQLKCCQHFTEEILKEKDINKLKENLFLKEVIKYFSKEKAFSSQIFEQFKQKLKNKKNIFITLSALKKILSEKENLSKCKKIKTYDEKEFIELFKENFSYYKETESKKIEELKDDIEEDLKAELEKHKNNMEIFINFLMEIIPVLCPDQDYFNLLKEISLDKPVAETDQQIFYDYVKKFIEKETDKNYKLSKEKNIFEIIEKENKDKMTWEQIEIFIQIFSDINIAEKKLIKEGKELKKGNVKKIDEIFGINKLWDAYINLKSEKLSDKLRLFIYNKLYYINNEEESLLEKCLEEINKINENEKYIDNNKLEQIINMINYIISESEKGRFTYIKSHSDILKEYIISIPLILNNENSSNEFEELSNEKKYLFYGNTKLSELRKIIHEKFDNCASDIKIELKIENSEETIELNSNFDNHTLISIRNEFKSEKIIFTGKIIESSPFEINKKINPKFHTMLNKWFTHFSKGEKEMTNKDLEQFFNTMDFPFNENINNSDTYSKEDFINFYEKLARDEPDIVWKNIEKMKYWKNFEKMKEIKNDEIKESKNLKRYILGNNKNLYNSLKKIFNKTKNKDHIFSFLNSLYTNESIYNEILDNFGNDSEEEKLIFEYSYELTIIASILQDLELSQLDLNLIFKENEIISEKYKPFDDEEKLDKKKYFLKNFILKGNNYLKKILDLVKNSMDEDDVDENFQFLNDILIKIIKIINFIQNISGQKIFYEINKVTNSIYFLNSNNIINKKKILDDDIIINEEEIKSFNEVILKFFEIFFPHITRFNEDTYLYVSNILLNITSPGNILKNMSEADEMNEEEEENNEYNEINDDENEGLKGDNQIEMFDLLYDKINISNSFMKCFEKYVNSLPNLKIEYNKKESEIGPPIMYEVSLKIINEKILNNLDSLDFDQFKDSFLFMIFFGQLIKIFNLTIDRSLLERIIEYIEFYFKGTTGELNLTEDIIMGLIGILTKVINIDKNNILEDYKERVEFIYERIKKIILEENVINKVTTKLNELKEKQGKMLSLEDINQFFDDIKKKAEGETLSDKTFNIYKDFIINFSNDSIVSKIIKQLLENIENYKNKEKNENKEEVVEYKGLTKNINLFYANSILQQLFYFPIFRDAILSVDIDHTLENEKMLKDLQNMFAYMKYSKNKVYDPNDFCEFFLPLVLVKEKNEGAIFIDIFFEQMEKSLKNTEYKYLLEDTFKITTITTNMCQECGEMENNLMKFNTLKLDIKGFSKLEDALKSKFKQTEINSLCNKCECKQNKTKKTSILNLPNILIIHLDRIHDNYEYGGKLVEKINSKLEFDFSLNLKLQNINICAEIDSLSEYREEGKECYDKIYKKKDIYYNYNLKGIITYFGNTEQGEYSSIIKDESKNKWIQFIDENVSPIDEGMVKYLSFGGEDGIPNAYFLIYERQNYLPIKILNKSKTKDNKEYDNFYISIENHGKLDEINRSYDISRLEGLNIIEEKDINKFIFYDIELDETFSRKTKKEIEKDTQINKELFIKIFEESNKFFNKNEKDEYQDCESKFSLIILDAINSKDFLLFNNENFVFEDIKKLIIFFKQQIFEDKLIETGKNFSSKLSRNLYMKKYINIFLKKLIWPILTNENKNEKIYELISLIGDIFLSEDNFKKIFQFKNDKRIFDNEIIKKLLHVIYQIIENLLDKKDYNKNLNFKAFFKTFFELIKKYTNDSLKNFDDGQIQENLICLFTNLYRIKKLDKGLFKLPIKDFLILLGQMKYSEKREVSKIIYDIISLLTEDNKKFSKLDGIGNLLDEKLLKVIFNENSEILSRIILRINIKDINEEKKFNKLIIPSLFNYAIKNNQTKKLLDLVFQIINIKDEYTLERLYLIMGFPQIIIEKQPEDEEDKNEISFNGEENNEIDDDDFWPKFGLPYLQKYKTEEMFKYISNIKIYESHCILAQLFPCSDDLIYDNFDFIKGEPKLNEEERKEYIYKLLSLALLNEGNYCLFKYIYLTPSRFIIKYKNLYEEILEILSEDQNNKFDLTEIKKNAEIYINLINYELKEDFENKSNSVDNNEKELQENLRKIFKEYKSIEEFTGFIPKHIPDKISKVIYYSDDNSLIRLEYYTTYKELETLRKEKHLKNKKEEIKDEDDNEDDEDNEDEENNNENEDFINIDDENVEMELNEHIFLLNFVERLNDSNKNYIGIIDPKVKEKNAKLSLLRFIFFNNNENETLFRENINAEEKKNLKYEKNFFVTDLPNIGYANRENYGEIFNTYRKDYNLEFANNIYLDAGVIPKNKINLPSESYINEYL